jgi:outer membrane immunogenic protein
MTCPCSDSARAQRAALGRRRALGRRLALCALLACVLGGPAAAADADSFLRGSLGGAPVRWDGVYIGGQIGYTNMNTDFSNSNTAVPLASTTTNSASYGGFLGYNIQWDDLVLGIDGGYTRPSSLATTSEGTSLGQTASSSMKLVDYATLRARAGYAFGQFLPYAFVGGAIARMNYSTTLNSTLIANRDNAINGGFTAGLGMDVAILPNVFLRGEWEYIAFGQVSGVRVETNSARAGLAVRF